MTDITLTAVGSSAARAMSLVLINQVKIEVPRFFSYIASAFLVGHFIGIIVSAPISERLADTLSIVAFIWLMAATFAVCVRGFYRLVVVKREVPNGR